jgi:phenolic acid decarboxylase
MSEGLAGWHFIYTYGNGWQYEMYVKSPTTIDYRIHSGLVGGRWVNDQSVDLVELGPGVYELAWTEPTGASVCVNVTPDQRRIHGVIFFPRWVHEHPERTVLFQNEHLPLMEKYRAAGPTYPLDVVPEFATITYLEYSGIGDESVIACPPDNLPPGYAERQN